MTARSELAGRLLAALREVPGLRPAPPALARAAAWLPGGADELAVDIDADRVEVRLIATALPLPPLLDAADAALRAVLDASGLPAARLRLVVTELDPAWTSAPP